MSKQSGGNDPDLSDVARKLAQVEESRNLALTSNTGEKLEAYRVAHKKSELLAGYVASHPEIISQVRAATDELRGAMNEGRPMSAHKVGYARVSTQDQDLTVQTEGLVALGVDLELIFTDHGLTGTNRQRPGLEKALAAVRAGDTFVVTKLDRLARSIPDAHDIANELVEKRVALSIGGSIYDPTDPIGKLLFNVLSMVAEFEADIIRARTREGMAVAKAKGKLKGRQSSVSPAKRKRLIGLYEAGKHTQVEIVEIGGLSRATLYRELEKHRRARVEAVEPRPLSQSLGLIRI